MLGEMGGRIGNWGAAIYETRGGTAGGELGERKRTFLSEREIQANLAKRFMCSAKWKAPKKWLTAEHSKAAREGKGDKGTQIILVRSNSIAIGKRGTTNRLWGRA